MSRVDQGVLVIGCGRFGASCASLLYNKGMQVTIIDKEKKAFRKLSNDFGGLTLQKDATDQSCFEQIEMQDSFVAIVVTEDDNSNCLISQMLHYRYPHLKILCRLSDPEKNSLLKNTGIETLSPILLFKEKTIELIQGEMK